MIISNNYGHCEYEFEKDSIGDYVHIFNLWIHPNFRRQGKAKELLLETIKAIRNTGWNDSIKIVASPSDDSISKDNLIKFYGSMGLEVFEYYG